MPAGSSAVAAASPTNPDHTLSTQPLDASEVGVATTPHSTNTEGVEAVNGNDMPLGDAAIAAAKTTTPQSTTHTKGVSSAADHTGMPAGPSGGTAIAATQAMTPHAITYTNPVEVAVNGNDMPAGFSATPHVNAQPQHVVSPAGSPRLKRWRPVPRAELQALQAKKLAAQSKQGHPIDSHPPTESEHHHAPQQPVSAPHQDGIAQPPNGTAPHQVGAAPLPHTDAAHVQTSTAPPQSDTVWLQNSTAQLQMDTAQPEGDTANLPAVTAEPQAVTTQPSSGIAHHHTSTVHQQADTARVPVSNGATQVTDVGHRVAGKPGAWQMLAMRLQEPKVPRQQRIQQKLQRFRQQQAIELQQAVYQQPAVQPPQALQSQQQNACPQLMVQQLHQQQGVQPQQALQPQQQIVYHQQAVQQQHAVCQQQQQAVHQQQAVVEAKQQSPLLGDHVRMEEGESLVQADQQGSTVRDGVREGAVQHVMQGVGEGVGEVPVRGDGRDVDHECPTSSSLSGSSESADVDGVGTAQGQARGDEVAQEVSTAQPTSDKEPDSDDANDSDWSPGVARRKKARGGKRSSRLVPLGAARKQPPAKRSRRGA